MRIDLPLDCLSFGFVNEPVGTHTSRTIMLAELAGLLERTEGSSPYGDYQIAAVHHNAVHKGTSATREKTFRHLRELYALSPAVTVFRALRLTWDEDPDGRPLLAAMCAVARDPVLRSTFDVIARLEVSQPVTSADFAEAVAEAFPGHYTGTVGPRIGRNVASSWTQAGFLSGRARKVRTHPRVTAPAVAYALFLSHLAGARGELLFSTVWGRMLDSPLPELKSLALTASRMGWLEYREAGGVIDVTFRHFERDNLEAVAVS